MIKVLIPAQIYLTVWPYSIVLNTTRPPHFDPCNPHSIITNDQPFNSIITFSCIIILAIHLGCKRQREQCTIDQTNTINETMYLSNPSTDVPSFLDTWPLDNLLTMLQDGITCPHDIVINRKFLNTHHVSNLLHCCCILIASSNILSQSLSQCLYGPREQYLDAFKTANSAKMRLSMSSSELSSLSKHSWMKAFLTLCSASASHSLIEIALLESLGILEGFFHMWWVHSTNKEKIPYCYFECFGVVKVAWFRLVELEVSKIKYFCLKKNYQC